MALIKLSNVTVDYPIFNGSRERSIKKKIFGGLIGGNIHSDNSKNKYIRALDNINLTINSGDRVGFYGLNGSGKSTLLKVLSGSIIPTSGAVIREGKVSSLIEFSMGLDGELTAVENIALRAGIKNMNKEDIKKFIEDVLSFSELEKFSDIQISQYSAGMSLRLAFAMSTYDYSDILILDEIIFVGDASFEDKIRLRLNTLISNAKILIIATHNHDLLKKYCNKIIELKNEKIFSIKQNQII
jgi:lipopolysaccharide transport system ATP-binding protein